MSDIAAIGSSRGGSGEQHDRDEVKQPANGASAPLRVSSPKRKASPVPGSSATSNIHASADGIAGGALANAIANTNADPVSKPATPASAAPHSDLNAVQPGPSAADRVREAKRASMMPVRRNTADEKRPAPALVATSNGTGQAVGKAHGREDDTAGHDRDAAGGEQRSRSRKDSPPVDKATYLGTSWVLGKKLGEGSFGEIYQAHNEKDLNDEVAVKFGRGEGKEMLQREAKVLYTLRGYGGVPEIRACYSEGDWCVMVMQLLGASLSDLLAEFEFTLKVVLILADQMIQHLEYIHSKNIIHGDLKPSNFLLGRGERRNQVVLIDFGLCEEYRSPETKKHIPFSDKHGFHGTPRYCSLHVHNGIASSRRDDMESLGYVLVYLMLGKLPWQNLPAEENETKKQKRRKIAEMKQSLPVEELCAGLPDEFATYINITRNLKFKQKPNYYALRMLFRDLFMRSEFGSYDDDWVAALERKKRRRPRSGGAAGEAEGLPNPAGGPQASPDPRHPMHHYHQHHTPGVFSPSGSTLAVAAHHARSNPHLPANTPPPAAPPPPRRGTLSRLLTFFGATNNHLPAASAASSSRANFVATTNGVREQAQLEKQQRAERKAKEKQEKAERKREKKEKEEREKREKEERRKSARFSKKL